MTRQASINLQILARYERQGIQSKWSCRWLLGAGGGRGHTDVCLRLCLCKFYKAFIGMGIHTALLEMAVTSNVMEIIPEGSMCHSYPCVLAKFNKAPRRR